MKRLLTTLVFSLSALLAYSQKQDYKTVVISFYNLENLYDTVNNPNVNDEEFLPSGPRNYSGAIYKDKLNKLSTVISQIGTEINPDGPAILGVAEVENDTVLKDLTRNPLIAKRNYQIVHYDSRDIRGVDVGLLYNPRYFTVEASNKLFVKLPAGAKDAYYTRDILWVKGKLNGETIHIYVNHWPSRSGGEERSRPGREAAARVARQHIDSIFGQEPNAKIVLMGDLNDDPVSPSVASVLNARGKEKEVKNGALFNPWTSLYRKGIGTLAYQDAWGLFDQIIISEAWLNKDQSGFFYYQPHIFLREYMVENKGRYKDYPMRTWDGNSYRGGYSDHFPTYIIFLKKVAANADPAKKAF